MAIKELQIPPISSYLDFDRKSPSICPINQNKEEEMDFHSFSRRELQALCKKNKIPANMTNIAMADALQTLQTVEGLDGIQEFLSPNKESMMSPDLPRTGRRTSVRRRTVQNEIVGGDKPVSTAPRTRQGADPQVSDEVTEEAKDDGDHLPENKDIAPEIPAIIGQNLSSSFTGKKEEEDLGLNLRLAGITLDESKHSEDDLRVEQATEIKTSPNRQTNLDIKNKIENLNVEPPSEITDSTVDKTILSADPSPILHETTTTTTTVSPFPSYEIESSEAAGLGGIYNEGNDNEKARGLTGLTTGDSQVDVRAEKQNQQKDLHELSLRKLRTLVKESIIKKNNNNKVEGKRSALAELNENQL